MSGRRCPVVDCESYSPRCVACHPELAREERIDHINKRADLEGWGLYDANGRVEIQRDDSRAYGDAAAPFIDDQAAWDFVQRRALEGSSLHKEALAIAHAALDEDEG